MKTYEDWNLSGFHVKRGEHARERDAEGNALFDLDQVYKESQPTIDELQEMGLYNPSDCY